MKVFLFPLGQSLLYPGTSKPLRIFEPRYLQMVRDSLDEGVPIAIGYVDSPDRPLKIEKGAPVDFVHDVAGFGRPQILETRPDGTLLVLLAGEGKVRLKSILDDSRPYLVIEAERIEEQNELSPEISASYLTLQKLLLSWLQNNIEDSTAREEFRRHLRTPQQIVGCAASYLVRDPDLQQLVLEADHIDEKVNLLSGMIGTALPLN